MGSRTRVSHRIGCFLTTFLLLSTVYGQSTTSPTPSATHAPQYVHEPTVVEFDIVFPREGETYAPADNFPIVLAVQNPMAALAFRPTTDWALGKLDETAEYQPRNSSEVMDSGNMDELGFLNYEYGKIQAGEAVPSNFTTDKNPHYFSYNTSMLNATVKEGKYWIQWNLGYFNCSHPPSDNRVGSWGPGWDYSSAFMNVTFTIKDGGIQPDQVALSNDQCEANSDAATKGTMAGAAMRVQNEIWVESNFGAASYNGHTYPGMDYHICANFTGTRRDNPANPCHNRINQEAAASIAAELGLPTGTPVETASPVEPASPEETTEDSAGYRHAQPSILWAVLAGVGVTALAM